MAQFDPPPALPGDATAGEETAVRGQGWGSQVAGLGLIMVLAGAWLVASPFLLDFNDGGAAVNAIACGGATIFLGAMRFAGVRHPAIGYLATLVGVWLFASSFIVGDLAREAWNARCLSVIVLFLGFAGIARPSPAPERERATSDPRQA